MRDFFDQLFTSRQMPIFAAALGVGLGAIYAIRTSRAPVHHVPPSAPPRSSRVRSDRRNRNPPRGRDWVSDYEPGPNGRINEQELADKGSEDSFPASDPPSHMVSVVPGAPAHRGAGAPASAVADQPGLLGDGTIEQNLNQRGRPEDKISQADVEAAFGSGTKKRR